MANFIGTAGPDIIDGTGDADTIDGRSGDDALDGRGGSDTIDGGEGNDTLQGNAGADRLNGGVGNDGLYGDDGDDYLCGAEGDDVQVGGAGNDISLGGSGHDGLYGDGGIDYLIGEDGNDLLVGGGDANTLQGGTGNDTYISTNVGDSILELVGEGLDEVRTPLGYHRLAANVENLVYTGSNSFAGIGNDSDNVITGGDGRDELYGNDGDDTLDDGGGFTGREDALLGGAGNDTYRISLIGTSTIEAADEGLDEVRTTLSVYVLQRDVENLSLIDDAAHAAGVGNDMANMISGGAGRDELYGRGGEDTLLGGAGAANILIGEQGNDVYVVEATGDSVIERPGEGVDTVLTALTLYQLADQVEQLKYTGSGMFTGIGNDIANYLVGGAGADFLSGGAGDDVLLGGHGDDEFIGGAGPDQFRYEGAEIGLDRIYDFASGSDKIMLDTAGFKRTGMIRFETERTATSDDSTFLYDTVTGIVSYDADGSAAAASVELARLDPALVLTVANFGFFGPPEQDAILALQLISTQKVLGSSVLHLATSCWNFG